MKCSTCFSVQYSRAQMKFAQSNYNPLQEENEYKECVCCTIPSLFCIFVLFPTFSVFSFLMESNEFHSFFTISSLFQIFYIFFFYHFSIFIFYINTLYFLPGSSIINTTLRTICTLYRPVSYP